MKTKIYVEMIHLNFYKVIRNEELVGCITSVPHSNKIYIYFMDMDLQVKKFEVLDGDRIFHLDIAEYERLLAEMWSK